MAKKSFKNGIAIAVFSLIWLALPCPVNSATVTVNNVSQLMTAVSNANSSGGNSIILIQDGTYTLTDTLYVNVPNVTIASASGIRENVTIQGDSMSSNAKVGNIFRVAASNFQLYNVTLQRCGWHTIQIVGNDNADYPVVKNCVLRDAYQQLLKVAVDLSNTAVASDYGVVENCLFEYSGGVGPQYYIGGIDAHAAKNWLVRNNTFRNIISPGTSVAEFAIHFWSDSANNVVERNLIIDCDRGIGFGMDTRTNTGGIIRNNMIYHSANKGQYADVAIALSESPGSQVYNNSIFMESSFPWAIELRFPSTTNVLVANNVTNKPIMSRDGATGTVTKNVTNAIQAWFINAATGDLHLASSVAPLIDAGEAISGLTEDFDGQRRPQGNGTDIGADEFLPTSTPQPPRHFRLIN